MKYSDLIEEKINGKKAKLNHKKIELTNSLSECFTFENIIQNKYTYYLLTSIILIIFRKKIPKFMKTSFKMMFMRYPLRSIIRKKKGSLGK